MQYWAKTDKNKNTGINVEIHCATVMMIGKALFKIHQEDKNYKKSKKLKLPLNVLIFLCISHDVGKIYLGFQAMCDEWVKKNYPNIMIKELPDSKWLIIDNELAYQIEYHGTISTLSIFNFLTSKKYTKEDAFDYAYHSGSHHGNVVYKSPKALQAIEENIISLESERIAFLKEHADISLPKINYQCNLPIIGNILKKKSENKKRELVVFLGMTIVSDWLASDEKYHDVSERKFDEKELQAEVDAQLEKINFKLPKIKKGLKFNEIFPELDLPNDLQTKSFENITKPGVYVIEAPMGQGKTEAALYAAYGLLEKGHNTGIYFALPTQATSNSMHERVQKFIDNICGENKVSLIHQMSWFDSRIYAPKTSSEYEENWFLSNRRALLSAFGVGTIDQALMSVMCAKGYGVRRFGLAGKVIIIDEVHSYDTYTGTLISKLCEECQYLGCTIIILSATLRKASRDDFVKINHKENPYPVISGTSGLKKIFIKSKEPEPKTVYISHMDRTVGIEKAIDAASQGAVVVWICNTIDSADSIYEKIIHSSQFEMGLFHARFPFFQKNEIEKKWINQLGKKNKNRKGCILVATQVIEQSVDIDADIMFSEIAPIDFMFQRMGRLHRHDFIRPKGYEKAQFVIIEDNPNKRFEDMSAKEIKTHFLPSSRFYDPLILVKTQIAFSAVSKIILPQDIRPMIEDVYAQTKTSYTGWEALNKESITNKERLFNKALMSINIYGRDVIDDTNYSTRADELHYENLVLAKSITADSITFLNGDTVLIDTENREVDFDIKRMFAKNMVRAPFYCFKEKNYRHPNAFVDKYTYGGILACVKKNGSIDSLDINEGVFMTYSTQYGVEINDSRGLNCASD